MAKAAIVLDEKSDSPYLPVQLTPERVNNMIERNLGGEPLSIGDLDRAVNPSGKSLKWEIPDIDEEVEATSEIIGVIIHSHNSRRYYEKAYDGSDNPPDCFSPDGVHGYGVMADKCGGLCVKCPFDVFGSGKNNSKLCTENKRVYVLREGEMLPTVVTLTPMNRRALRTYGARLMNKRSDIV